MTILRLSSLALWFVVALSLILLFLYPTLDGLEEYVPFGVLWSLDAARPLHHDLVSRVLDIPADGGYDRKTYVKQGCI